MDEELTFEGDLSVVIDRLKKMKEDYDDQQYSDLRIFREWSFCGSDYDYVLYGKRIENDEECGELPQP